MDKIWQVMIGGAALLITQTTTVDARSGAENVLSLKRQTVHMRSIAKDATSCVSGIRGQTVVLRIVEGIRI